MTDVPPPPVPPPEPGPRPPIGPPVAPPPGYAVAGGYSSYPIPHTRTNGFAVASMILGIVGAVGMCVFVVPSLLAIIFGAVALSQIKNHPETYSGRGMAIAGLVLGIVALVALALFVIIASIADYNVSNGN
jgi:Domain of unknown function (DUF4190)